MKKTLICILICICISTAAMAENILFPVIAATGELESWGQLLRDMDFTDESDIAARDLFRRTLSAVSSFCIAYASGNCSLAESADDLIQREAQYKDIGDNTIVQTEVFWLNEMSAYTVCDIIYRDDYCYATDSMYDQSGAYLGTEYLEIGQRDNNIMIALIRYDALLDMTSRYAMLIEYGAPAFIYSVSLGNHLNVVLDVNAWQQGGDVENWGTGLLLPVSAVDE